MEPQNIKLSKILKKIKSPEFVYLSVLFIFFVIVLVLFINSVNFISENINKIFSPVNSGNSQAINMESYALVTKKLNLPTNTAENSPTLNIEAQTSTTPSTSTPTTTVTMATPEVPLASVAPVLDKKSITINILNSTTKKEMSSTLAKALVGAGFSTATTGNEKSLYDLTTIIIADDKKEYSPSIEEVVKKSYPEAIIKTTTETTKFDVTIIIGTK